MRISERSRVEASADRREYAEGAWRRYTAAVDTMNTADDAEDFQAIGVKCREALLALARENRDASWVGDVADPPQADNLKGWMEIFAARLVPDRRQRAYLKDLTDKTWDIAVGLQHNTNATPFDAELVLNSVQHLLGFFMLVRVKHKQGPPERCPRCGSYRLVPTGNWVWSLMKRATRRGRSARPATGSPTASSSALRIGESRSETDSMSISIRDATGHRCPTMGSRRPSTAGSADTASLVSAH
jgi:hypothetical protein